MGLLSFFGLNPRTHIQTNDSAGYKILATSPRQTAIDSPGTPGQYNPFLALDGLANFVTGMGTTSDKTTHSRYMPGLPIDRITADSIFESSWSGKRLVVTPADDMVRKWRKIKWDGMDKGAASKGLPAITAEEKRVQLKKRVHQCIQWSRLYGGCIGVMMIRGQANAAAMREPLDVERLGKDCLLGILVFDRWRVYGMPPDKVPLVQGQTQVDASIVAPYLNQSLGDPNFGLPEFYFLADSAVQVHHSRCVRFNGVELPWYEWMRNALWDDSVYRATMSATKNYDSIVAGAGTLITEANQDVVSAEGLWDLLATDKGTGEVLKRYQLLNAMKGTTRLMVLDKDKETYTRNAAQFSGVAQILADSRTDLAGAYDMPMTRLFGQSPGGLGSNGDGEQQNWDDHIQSKQELDLGPQLEKIDQVLVRSALGYMPENFQSDFRPLRQMNELQASQMRLNKANADKIWFDMGVATEGLIARERSNDGSFETMEDDDVAMAKELGEARSEKEMEDLLNPPEPPVPPAVPAKPGEEGAAVVPKEESEAEAAKPVGKETD
ncbi:MAG: anti-CBASS protein Acb1 family protein [Polyangia bacterium]